MGEGIDFVYGHQLLEASVVNVPANPDALLEASLLDLRHLHWRSRQAATQPRANHG